MIDIQIEMDNHSKDFSDAGREVKPEGRHGGEIAGSGHNTECGSCEQELEETQCEPTERGGHALYILHPDSRRIRAFHRRRILHWVNQGMAHVHISTPTLKS